jgi:hypothetical protein
LRQAEREKKESGRKAAIEGAKGGKLAKSQATDVTHAT